MPMINTLLLKCSGTPAAPEGLAAGFQMLAAQCGIAAGEVRVHEAVDGGEYYVYLESVQPDQLDASDMARLAEEARNVPELTGMSVTASRLDQMLEIVGASRGGASPYHYCVEIDPAQGWEIELAHWYDTEHMPGLALAPGCARARRFLNLDNGPGMFACYDLASPAVRETKVWLDVVATPWASRVRPNFRNTKRTMFRRIMVA
jgi:hypothetical protein